MGERRMADNCPPRSLQRQVSDGFPKAGVDGCLGTPVLQLVCLRGSHGHVALGAWRDKMPGDSGPAGHDGCGMEGEWTHPGNRVGQSQQTTWHH